MKVNSKQLAAALKKAKSVIPSKAMLPILENFRLQADNGTLHVTGGDLEVFVTAEVPCTGNINCCVDAKLFYDTMNALPDIEVDITVNKSVMAIVTHNGKFSLPTLDIDDYPRTHQYDGEGVIFTTGELSDAIDHTLFCTTNDELRPAMTGIYFHGQQCVATDAHRLAIYECPDFQQSFILPAKAAKIIAELNRSAGGGLYVEENQAIAKIGNDTITARIIDATYPNYEAVIPKNNKLLHVDKNIAINSIKRVAIFANNITNLVSLSLSDEQITLQAAYMDFGNEAFETLEADYDGDKMKIGFNAKFLIEGLNSINQDDITIEFGEPSTAVVIRGDKEFVLLMPIMLT